MIRKGVDADRFSASTALPRTAAAPSRTVSSGGVGNETVRPTMKGSDLERLNLRGRVRTVTVHYRGPFVRERIEESAFDADGRCIRRHSHAPNGAGSRAEYHYGADGELQDPGIEVVRYGDGSRVEIHPLPSEATGWSMEGLHNIAFPTLGAAVARTRFHPRGGPEETVLEDASGYELAKIAYECDAIGRIRQAVQYSESESPLESLEVARIDKTAHGVSLAADLSRCTEQVRASFEYDDAHRLVELAVYILGQRRRHTVNTYNDHGDMVTSITDGEPPIRFKYEYDQQLNWVRKEIHYSGGSNEQVRKITYYDV